jgi:Rrf2 family iron-sulfur cluster assembly transcriptional regulator
MLSQTTEYALAAAVHLAGHQAQGPVRVDDIAEELGVPRNYLSKILHSLARVGVLTSTRGPGGGFELARDADEIRLCELVSPFEPALMSSNGDCLLGRERCRDDDPCAAHARWKDVRAGISSFFSDTTLGDLVETKPAERSVG